MLPAGWLNVQLPRLPGVPHRQPKVGDGRRAVVLQEDVARFQVPGDDK